MPTTAEAARAGRRWVKPLARMGYAARGLVYLVIGVFALAGSVGSGGVQDSRSALETLLASTGGGVLAIILIVGLAGYALWRYIQSLLDTDDHGLSAKGLAIRGGLLVSGITYSVLTLYTLSLWRGHAGGNEGGGDFAQALAGFIGARPTAWLLSVVFIGVAGAHAFKAVTKAYRNHIRVPGFFDRMLDPVARTGLLARGAVFAIISLLLATRGLTASESGGTPGLREALQYVTGLPGGQFLLGAMGAGLIAFSIYSFIEALWRRVNVEAA